MKIREWLQVGPSMVEGMSYISFEDKSPDGWIEPYHWYDWEGSDAPSPYDVKCPEIFEHEDVPRKIWQFLDGGFQKYDNDDIRGNDRFLDRYIFYYSKQEALDALSRAAIKWAKKEKNEKLQKFNS